VLAAGRAATGRDLPAAPATPEDVAREVNTDVNVTLVGVDHEEPTGPGGSATRAPAG